MDKKGFLKGAALGALIASAAALLCAPQSGKRTRKDAQKFTHTMLKKMLGKARSLHSISKETYEKMLDSSLADYSKGKKITSSYLHEMKALLSSHWNEIQKVLKQK